MPATASRRLRLLGRSETRRRRAVTAAALLLIAVLCGCGGHAGGGQAASSPSVADAAPTPQDLARELGCAPGTLGDIGLAAGTNGALQGTVTYRCTLRSGLFAFLTTFPDDSSEASWAANASTGWGLAVGPGWGVTSPDGNVISAAILLGAHQV